MATGTIEKLFDTVIPQSLKVDFVAVIGIAAVIFLIVVIYLLSRPIERFVQKWIRELLVDKLKESSEKAQLLSDITKPLINLLRVTIVFLLIDVFFHDILSDKIIKFLQSLIVLNIFYVLILITKPILKNFYSSMDPGILSWISRIIKTFIIFIMVSNVLSTWDIEIAPIIAGFGVFGAGVAIAAQDFFANIIAGAVIITERKFVVGHKIKISGVAEGIVVAIRLRSTEILQYDKSPIFVPNSKISNNVLINYSLMKSHRIKMIVGLEYSTTVEQLKRISDQILAFIKSNNRFSHAKNYLTYVRLAEFADSSINLEVYCFTSSGDLEDYLEVREILNFKIKEIVDNEKANFAFPSQTIYISNES